MCTVVVSYQEAFILSRYLYVCKKSAWACIGAKEWQRFGIYRQKVIVFHQRACTVVDNARPQELAIRTDTKPIKSGPDCSCAKSFSPHIISHANIFVNPISHSPKSNYTCCRSRSFPKHAYKVILLINSIVSHLVICIRQSHSVMYDSRIVVDKKTWSRFGDCSMSSCHACWLYRYCSQTLILHQTIVMSVTISMKIFQGFI